MEPIWIDWAKRLQAIAQTGLTYADSQYDVERYKEVRHIAAEMAANRSEAELPRVLNVFSSDAGYATPKVDVRAVIFHKGSILLVRERSDGRWTLPGGWADVGETPAQAAERELWEEAGVHGRATRLLGLFDSRQWGTRSRMQLTLAIFQVETDEIPALHDFSEDGSPASFHETLAVDFFAENDLPALHLGHHLRVPFVFQMLRGEVPLPYFDR